MMSGYVLSIVGIIFAGVIVDVIIPAGSTAKYIKSIYAVFVVAILILPIINFINNNKGFVLEYDEYEVNEKLLNYIYSNRVETLEDNILNGLKSNGLENIDIEINYSIENEDLVMLACTINLKNLVINENFTHINKYDYIKKVVKDYIDLSDEEIIIYE